MGIEYVSSMIRGFSRALRYARGWKTGNRLVQEEEFDLQRGDRAVPTSIFHVPGSGPSSPTWVVMHGLTRPGRHHPMLLRFVHALAGTGARVIVPEIPEWRELYLAPEEAEATIRASVLWLCEGNPDPVERIGVMGFSLGVAQVLLAASRPELAKRIKGVAGFGGYATLDRTVRFLFNGEHEWQGKTHVVDPDPYGRWVVGGNFLTLVPGYEEAGDVAEALLGLARQAGDLQVAAWEEGYDAMKDGLRQTVHPSRQDLFRAFAPPAGQYPPQEVTAELAPALAQAGLTQYPEYDPISFVHRIPIPVRLVHGRGDRLIPYSESLRLAEAFPPDADLRMHLTGLFAHSQKGQRADRSIRERLRFMRIMSDLLTLT